MALLVISVLSWLSEIISWSVGHAEEIWYFTDILSLLQGVFIFVFCVYKSRVRDAVLRRLSINKVLSKISTSGTRKTPPEDVSNVAFDGKKDEVAWTNPTEHVQN